jgi:hypothetical protein
MKKIGLVFTEHHFGGSQLRIHVIYEKSLQIGSILKKGVNRAQIEIALWLRLLVGFKFLIFPSFLVKGITLLFAGKSWVCLAR